MITKTAGASVHPVYALIKYTPKQHMLKMDNFFYQ